MKVLLNPPIENMIVTSISAFVDRNGGFNSPLGGVVLW